MMMHSSPLLSARFSVKLVLLLLVLATSINLIYLGFSFNHRGRIYQEPLLEPVWTEESDVPATSHSNKTTNYKNRYPHFTDCSIQNYPKWSQNETATVEVDNKLYARLAAASVEHQEARIVRAILIYFPIESIDAFEYEFRWLYRSWIEMMKSEPAKWRTDLIVFINKQKMAQDVELFRQLNCSFANKRLSNDQQLPMCTLLDYLPIRYRNLTSTSSNWLYDSLSKRKANETKIGLYDFLLKKVNIFRNGTDNAGLDVFYHYVMKRLASYKYTDSILMAFDGYEYFKEAGYNFLIRSDMDVFLTPLFGKWAPKYCNDFYVGKGKYNNEYNARRLERIAGNMGLDYAGVMDVGSTWYSTPDQFKLVAFLTLVSMGYLSQEEFSPYERQGRFGEQNWPYWHFGVLLLYGQNLAMNHLIANKDTNIVKLHQLIDAFSASTESVDEVLHIHVFHGYHLFSKFVFKQGRYDELKNKVDTFNTTQAKYYALKLALEAKFFALDHLSDLLKNRTSTKI